MSNEMVNRHDIRPGMFFECPYRSTIGNHNARVTHVDMVGTTQSGRTVVSLSCGHDVNMSNGHALYSALPRIGDLVHCIQIGHYGEHAARPECMLIDNQGRCQAPRA